MNNQKEEGREREKAGTWSEGCYGRKDQIEATRAAITQKNSKPKAVSHSWRDFKFCIKNMKNTGVVIPTMFAFNIPSWPVSKTDGSWKITVRCCKLTQVFTPTAAIAATASNVVHCLSLLTQTQYLVYSYCSGECLFSHSCQ